MNTAKHPLAMITGTTVTLRPATLNDRRQIFAWLALSDTTASMIGPPDFTGNPVPSWEDFKLDYHTDYFDVSRPGQGKSFIIEADETGIGHISYHELDPYSGTAELDIWLAGSRYCNKGFGTDAINALCWYLSGQLHFRRFVLAPSARNKAAVRSYGKCGFVPTGEVPPNFIPDYPDTVIMIKEAGS